MSVFQSIAEALNRAAQVHLPPPSRGLRTFDYNETLVMFRNRDRYMPTHPETGSFETRVALSKATEATEYEAAAMSAASTDELCTLNNYRGL